MKKRTLSMLALVCMSTMLAFPHPGLSASEDTTAPPKKTKTTTECTHGQIWDKKAKKCVDPKNSELDDDSIFEAARELAYAGRYEYSLTALDAVKDQTSARILNYRGYANRKAGRMDVGMAFYKRAIEKDGNYILARSYMGQALVEQGKTSEAEAQLAEIRNRGGESTWAYRTLFGSLNGSSSY
jgi:tetratricopeptide (TPR) repeat protein